MVKVSIFAQLRNVGAGCRTSIPAGCFSWWISQPDTWSTVLPATYFEEKDADQQQQKGN